MIEATSVLSNIHISIALFMIVFQCMLYYKTSILIYDVCELMIKKLYDRLFNKDNEIIE